MSESLTFEKEITYPVQEFPPDFKEIKEIKINVSDLSENSFFSKNYETAMDMIFKWQYDEALGFLSKCLVEDKKEKNPLLLFWIYYCSAYKVALPPFDQYRLDREHNPGLHALAIWLYNQVISKHTEWYRKQVELENTEAIYAIGMGCKIKVFQKELHEDVFFFEKILEKITLKKNNVNSRTISALLNYSSELLLRLLKEIEDKIKNSPNDRDLILWHVITNIAGEELERCQELDFPVFLPNTFRDIIISGEPIKSKEMINNYFFQFQHTKLMLDLLNVPDAKKAYETVQTKHPTHGYSLKNLFAYSGCVDYCERPVEIAIEALSFHPENPLLLCYLGNIYEHYVKIGWSTIPNLEVTTGYYLAAIEKDPHPRLYVHLARILIENNKHEDSLKALQTSLKLALSTKPLDIPLFLVLGEQFKELNQNGDAVNAYLAILKTENNHAEANKKLMQLTGMDYSRWEIQHKSKVVELLNLGLFGSAPNPPVTFEALKNDPSFLSTSPDINTQLVSIISQYLPDNPLEEEKENEEKNNTPSIS